MMNQAYAQMLSPVLDWVLQARANGRYTFEPPFESGAGARARLGGREVLMLSTGNYLGLADHPEIRQAMRAALDEFGASSCGARINNGTTTLHRQLEARLAEWTGKESAIAFSSGYLANLGTISALCDADTVIVTDQFNHMSILDGCRLAEGTVKIFTHNSIDKLQFVLQRNADARKLFVVVDGVYSMDGELAPLDQIHKLAEQYGALLMVDEAHGIGVLGARGAGAAEHFGVPVDIVMGSFSKSLAGIGGFVAGTTALVEYIRHFSHAYTFNASLPPVVVAGVLKALELMERESWRIAKLWRNTLRFRSGLIELGFDVMGSVTPVVPILIGDDEILLDMAKDLLDGGVYLAAAIPPAVPKGKSRFRANATASLEDEDIDRALDLLGRAAKRYGLLR
ncbi:MAG: pyridoxal phosphate-dependent aminotransferase family protein [Actinobacteria bacterium]|nr:MAG: pyridoxal phosphate-dependent aminotransferase family protein [Actinomycetota bacterium]